LRDAEAALAAVWFRGCQHEAESFDPLTGEVYKDGSKPGLSSRLENGMEVICAGRLTVYPPRGTYQLVVELMQDAGMGKLQLEFELLKVELARKGYFDPSRKRALPANPKRVGVVTSPRGAAIYDFLHIAKLRGIPAEIRIYPALVQGDEAGAQISARLEQINLEGWAEVIVLIRGGGALEDLWAFNTRLVADAVFNSRIPVLAGIGHEVDVSLADMTADFRAATPTHAAQLLWKERREFWQRVDELELSCKRLLEQKMFYAGRLLESMEKNLRLLSPAGMLERSTLRLAEHVRRLHEGIRRKLADCVNLLERRELALTGLNPELPLERGYALIRREDGSFLRSRFEAIPGERLEIRLVDGGLPVVVDKPDCKIL